jgi:AraC family transcriptional regulator
MTQRLAYVARIHAVVDHIDAHLAEALDLARLAALAHFSPWHFHRLFQAFTGETLADRVRRRRLEVAASRLLATPPPTALSVALDVGFGSAEAFTRAFKAHFGTTPSDWRGGGHRDWVARRRREMSKLRQPERKPDQAIDELFREDEDARQYRRGVSLEGAGSMQVELKTLPDARVAYMRHTGPYGDPGIGRMWQRFEAWCRTNRLIGPGHALYGVSRDSPDITAPDKCRYDACVTVDDAFRAEGEIGVQAVPGGLYACTPFSGTADHIHGAWMRFYAEWLPNSGYQADDRPAVEAYGDALQLDPKTGVFSCQLCLPVRAA